MHVSRSRLVGLGTALLVIAGGVLAAGSFASGTAGPRRALPPLERAVPKRPAVPAAPRKVATGTAQRTFVSAGSGNDASPCTRALPCRNFQAAIAKAVSGGEVVALDSGGYGPVTINQAISLIAPPGVYAGISVFSGAGITISAGPSDAVTIHGLTVNGVGGHRGIDFNSGAELYVYDSLFKDLSTSGINANLSADGSVVVQDSVFTRSGAGVVLATSSGTIQGTVEHSRFEGGFNGVVASSNSVVVVRDSVATGNSGVGFYAAASGSQLDVENSLTARNFDGIATASGNIRVSQTTIEENTNGLVSFGGGTIASFGNNRLAGNGTNGAFTSTIPLQ